MTSDQALRWLESRTCVVIFAPGLVTLRVGAVTAQSTNGDAGMRIIECVTKAMEATS